ncbi:hypothetical protein TKK_0006102 [Trichogramma kaykai]
MSPNIKDVEKDADATNTAIIDEEGKSSSDESADFSCRCIIRQAFERRRHDKPTVDVLIKSISEGTMKQYNSALKKWANF